MIGKLIDMINYLLGNKKAYKVIIHIAPGFIAKIEIPKIFKLEDWENNLK